MRSFFFFLFLGGSAFSIRSAPLDPADLLFDAFLSKCQGHNALTSRVLGETSALQKILESLKDDKECQGLSPIIQSITTLSQQLEFLAYGFDGEENKSLERHIRSLQKAIVLEEDPIVKIQFISLLGQAKIERLQTPFEEEKRERLLRQRAFQHLTNYIQVISEYYPTQTLCFQKYRSLPFQLAGHLLSLSGGFYGPEIQTATILAGQLFASFFNFVDTARLTKYIKKIRNSKMPAALSCALEALEQTVCDIQDQKKLIQKHENYLHKMPTEITWEWQGYHLLIRDYPLVKTFLNEIEAGTKSKSELQGYQKHTFRQKEGQFKATVALLEGSIGEVERQLNLIGSSDTETKQRILGNLVQTIAGVLTSSGSTYSSVIPQSENYVRIQLWLRIGTPSPPLGNLKSYAEYLAKLDSDGQEFKLPDIVANLEAIHEAARIQLSIQRKLTLNPDPSGVLVGFTQPNNNNTTPETVMLELIQYLNHLEEDWNNHPEWFSTAVAEREQLKLLQETRLMFQETVTTLQNAELKPEEKLQKVFEIMSLQEQDQIITSRLRRLVSFDLEKRVRFGLLTSESNLEVIIRLATEDLIATLSPLNPKALETLKPALQRANQLAQANLMNFFVIFQEGLLTSFQLLKRQAELIQEGPLGDNHKVLGELCVLNLNNPQIPPKIKIICEQVVLGQDEEGHFKQDLQGQPIRISFSEEATKKPEERFCSYRRFRNKLELYESLR